ncbi:hypothetical protein ACJMK2_026702 [Sinanodonta woodiana]|uniref:ZP domain-containing protein n=1 Tax=Sinanodonta woodiana TaxID=1069815 RepID=A0ABD3XKL5_SINWO
MEIADNNNMTINTSSNVHIGDRLRLIISGNDKFKFTAQSCEATDAAAKSHVKQLTHDGITDDESVISNFSLLQNYSGHNRSVKIEATLYAFHFIDSNSIVITCTITVCELDDDNCHLKTTLRVIDNERKVATTNGGSETSGASGGKTPYSRILYLRTLLSEWINLIYRKKRFIIL